MSGMTASMTHCVSFFSQGRQAHNSAVQSACAIGNGASTVSVAFCLDQQMKTYGDSLVLPSYIDLHKIKA